jgi:hypothetical protein
LPTAFKQLNIPLNLSEDLIKNLNWANINCYNDLIITLEKYYFMYLEMIKKNSFFYKCSDFFSNISTFFYNHSMITIISVITILAGGYFAFDIIKHIGELAKASLNSLNIIKKLNNLITETTQILKNLISKNFKLAEKIEKLEEFPNKILTLTDNIIIYIFMQNRSAILFKIRS